MPLVIAANLQNRYMGTSTVQRGLFAMCSVTAVLEQIRSGIEWQTFLKNTRAQSLVTEVFSTTTHSAVVGHSQSLEPLRTHIKTSASKSYRIGEPKAVNHIPLAAKASASANLVKQTQSADKYAQITLDAEPSFTSPTIQLVIPDAPNIPAELHYQSMANAILDGICIAALKQYDKPIVGFRVVVVDAKWHTVDSSESAFKSVSCQAMSDIIRACNRDVWYSLFS